MMPITRRANTIVTDDYDLFTTVAGALGGGIYHHPGWREVFDAYGLRTYWLVAQHANKPVGIMPLVRQSSPLFGHRLISLPWVDEAGALGDSAAILALLEHAALLVQENGPKFSLSVKQPMHGQIPELPKGWSMEPGDKVLMRRPLSMTSDNLWKELSPKVRNQVRKAEKNGLTTERGGSELVGEFYRVYSHNMRDLGSPAHSFKFFKKLMSVLGDRACIYCTRLDGDVVGAGLVFDNRPSMDIPWASSLRAYNRLCVNHALYWHILSDACTSGYQWFHFGRSSTGSGQHRFKKQWGAEEAPLVWLHYMQDSARPANDSPAAVRDRFGLAQRVWTKLPLGLSQRLGPYIIRHTP